MADRENLNDSLVRLSSTLTSCPSDASLELYEDKIKPTITTIKSSQAPLQGLVLAAEKVVEEQFAPYTYTYKYYKTRTEPEEISVQLDAVILAMLACVGECGGDGGTRYVASAVLACSYEEDVVGALAALGTTWLTQFLFAFVINRDHGYRSESESDSECATPAFDETGAYISEGAGSGEKRSFHNSVFARDGYSCVVTGVQDRSHPKLKANMDSSWPVLTYFVEQSANLTTMNRNPWYKSAVAAFDILRNFTCLPYQTLEELEGKLEDPSNGITLEINACIGFDSFDWCLKQTEQKDMYYLKIFRNTFPVKPEKNSVSFQDCSNDFLSGSADKRNPPVDLPNAEFIAIHAAIAEVLNMSGAGRFFSKLLNRYEDDEGDVPSVQCWSELEMLMGKELIQPSEATPWSTIFYVWLKLWEDQYGETINYHI